MLLFFYVYARVAENLKKVKKQDKKKSLENC